MGNEKDRTLPEPDKFASCPHDGKILSFYEEQFESVFVLLHPFYKPQELDIDTFCSKSLSKIETIQSCEKVSWESVISESKLTSISQIDIGLKTGIGGLNAKYSNANFMNLIEDYLNTFEVLPPEEGFLSPFLENRLYKAIQKLGYGWLWIGDEFCTEKKLHWIDDLIDGDETLYAGMLFTPDKKILITTHWDSHFSFICSSKEIIDKLVSYDDFEGFYCDEDTEVYWSVHT